MSDPHEVIVIGGGQAGLAMGYHLARQGRDFTILEAAAERAAAWRARWDSLRLFTPARYDGLPGRAFPGESDSYPTRDQVVDYLTDYASEFDLPVELNRPVRVLRKAEDGYVVELDDRTYEADQVVVATGPFQIPRLPVKLAEALDPGVVQMHSSDDGSSIEVDAVVWSTGFDVDHTWIEAPVFDDAGRAVHDRGVTESPGLYFLGLPWLHTRGSALLGWVKHDAEHIAGVHRSGPAPARVRA